MSRADVADVCLCGAVMPDGALECDGCAAVDAYPADDDAPLPWTPCDARDEAAFVSSVESTAAPALRPARVWSVA